MKKLVLLILVSTIAISSCDDETNEGPKNPETAEIVSVDRFSDAAATLMKRSENANLPEANEPVNFDLGDFITQGYGPDGKVVKYYNFDVQKLAPAPIYTLYKEGSESPVADQLNVIDVIPGETGYNDFWVVYKVIVPEDYVANTVSSYDDILDKGYEIEYTKTLVNCPIVPQGSTASLRLGNESTSIDRGWYKDKIVYYFTFMEAELQTNSAGLNPISPIYVTFNINPDDMNPESGPASGVVTETGSLQTHGVVATVPGDADYSPLWSVYVYDNADFDSVDNLQTAQAANILAEGVMYVNCPIVYVAL
ncbi:MAG: hypothetical protein C0597_03665 [Marinilabiliales bacterium]|nr:MAG: hypothetical protein C0597_03665 [Marinilabiliales bacterium]